MTRYDPFSSFAQRPLGPLVAGGFGRCGCDPTRGESCRACDGTDAERFYRRGDDERHPLPPCMCDTDEEVA